jgi:type I restriction-modification system DNA methylase subunit
MADLDFLDIGFSEADLREPQSAYQKLILEIANQVTADFVKYIGENVHNKGGLMQSVVYMPTGAMSFEIQADEYYKFQDQGVNAIPEVPGYDYKRARVQESPFSFKYSNVSKNMAEAIQEWKGGSMSKAYATASSIKHHGLKPRNITENVMTESVLEKIASDLATVTGLIFNVSFTKSTETWQ